MQANEKIPTSRQRSRYKNEIRKNIKEHFKYQNEHQIPILEKIVLSMGLGGGRDIKRNQQDMTMIAGQHAVITQARKSISQFGIRKGHDAGAKVTLRNEMMYHFIDRLRFALLNWKTFTGFNPRSISIKGRKTQFCFGVPDKTIFQGIQSQGLKSEGLDIIIVANCASKEEFIYLIEQFGLPFRRT